MPKTEVCFGNIRTKSLLLVDLRIGPFKVSQARRSQIGIVSGTYQTDVKSFVLTQKAFTTITPKYNSVYATPTGHKGVLYLVTRTGVSNMLRIVKHVRNLVFNTFR